MEEVAAKVDFVFCAVNMKKDEIKALEEAYAKAECPVVSNNSAHRFTPDVPMVVPEINADHIDIIPAQRKRLGTKRGFVAVKSNCSLQSYVPALHPLRKYGISDVLVCTYQAISGAGKTFETFPDILDNVIPYIPAAADGLLIGFASAACAGRKGNQIKPGVIFQQRNKALADHTGCTDNTNIVLFHPD